MPLLKRPDPTPPKQDAKIPVKQTPAVDVTENPHLQNSQPVSTSSPNPTPSTETSSSENLLQFRTHTDYDDSGDESVQHPRSQSQCGDGDETGSIMSNDENMNVLRLDDDIDMDKDKDKSKPKGIMESILQPDFSFFQIRFPTVLNLFGDWARYIGLMKKREVHFPKEVVRAAEVKGETSPDGNNVPLIIVPYTATYSQKKANVVRVARGAEFKPRLPWIGDTNKCELCCERFLTSCNCIGEYKDPKVVLKEKAKKRKHRRKEEDGQPKLSKLTESFMSHVNIADLFLIGHKTRTLNSALEYVDGVPDSKVNSASKVTSKESAKSHLAEANSTSGTGMEGDDNGFEDELPPLSTSRLGRLATNIWIFGACIPQLFAADDAPTEQSYRKLMGYLAGIAIASEEAARDVIGQSKDFHNYAEEAMRVIRNLQMRIFLQGVTEVKPPLRMGQGLRFARTRLHSGRPAFEILVARQNNDKKPLEFKKFTDWDKGQKLNALRNLAVSTLVEFDTAKHQIDFLVDDIKETTYDSKNDTDLLYRLSEMYHCIIRISEKTEIHPTEKTVAELKVICETMSKFVLSLHSFIGASEHIMEKIMEVRDMVQLTYIYLQEDVSIDLSKLVPADIPGLPSKMGFNKGRKKLGCCGRVRRRLSYTKECRLPKYDGSDFFRVFYEDAFDGQDCVVDGYVFRVIRSTLPKDQIRAKNPHRKPIIFRQRSKRPSRVGSMDAMEFFKDDFGDEDIPLKPILKEPSTPVPETTDGHLTRTVEEDEAIIEVKEKVKQNSL